MKQLPERDDIYAGISCGDPRTRRRETEKEDVESVYQHKYGSRVQLVSTWSYFGRQECTLLLPPPMERWFSFNRPDG